MSRMREVWGVFAVNDHLRERAFVADVLLYDRLLVPYPPSADAREHWRSNGWDPDSLERRLETLERGSPDTVLRVPWTEQRTAEIRREWARQVEIDRRRMYGNLDAARGNHPSQYSMSRRDIISDVETQRTIQRDQRTGYLAGTKGVYGDVFPAYGSSHDFACEWVIKTPLEPEDDLGTKSRIWRLSCMFQFELFVPEDRGRTDGQLIDEAIGLAKSDNFREKRAQFHALRREYLHAGLSEPDVLADLEARLAAYREVTARNVLRGRLIQGLTIVGVGTAAAATLVDPAIGVGSGVCQLARVAVEKLIPQRQIAEELKPVAMLHDARAKLSP